VTFDDTTQTAIVTLHGDGASGRAGGQGKLLGKGHRDSCQGPGADVLGAGREARASAAASILDGPHEPPRRQRSPCSTPTVQIDSPSHHKVQRDLLSGSVVSWEVAPAEYGSTPFRPVYAVKLQRLDGTLVDASRTDHAWRQNAAVEAGTRGLGRLSGRQRLLCLCRG